MLDPITTERIRSIFLHLQPAVTIGAAAEMLGLSREEIVAAIDAGEIEVTATGSGPRIDIREVAEQALHVWSIGMVEEALGEDAARILPPGVRTRSFTARLPRYVIAALARLAEENAESVEAFLTRELHGLAYENKEHLAAVIPGFAEAIEWPLPASGSPVC